MRTAPAIDAPSGGGYRGGGEGGLAMQATGEAAPVAGEDRIAVLDVLRGFALLGVFMVNLVGFGQDPIMATEAQAAALPSAGADKAVSFAVTWLVEDKANTLFAFLFGVGFWVQLDRLERRGVAFRRLYVRRLAVLLAIGTAHLFLLWPWDVLHLYALAGFALLMLRGLGDRSLLLLGVVLGVAGRFGGDAALAAADISGPAFAIAYGDAAALARQAAALSGSYPAWVRAMADLVRHDWLAGGMILSWFLYALGRFLIGALVARRGWLQRAHALRPAYRRSLAILLPAGLAGELAATIGQQLADAGTLGPPWGTVAEALHMVAMPALAAAYLCAIVLLAGSGRAAWLVRGLGAAGRMALTNYVLQSVVILLVYSRIGPGLGLAGSIGAAGALPIAIAVLVAQAGASALWFRHYRYGPLEWAWRVLTYGARPAFRARTVATGG